MDRQFIFYYDWQAASGWKYRLCMLPAHNTTVDRGTPPEFGEDPEPDTVYRRIGRGIMKGTSEIEVGFEGRPVGMPDTATANLSLQLHDIEGDTPDMDLFRSYVLNPTWPPFPGASVDHAQLYTAFVISHDVTARNTWVLYSDRGVLGATISSFAIDFIGVQNRSAGGELEIGPLSADMEIELVDIYRAAGELVTTADWCLHMDFNYDPEGPYTFINDVYYEHEGRQFARLLGNGDQDIFLFSLVDLWRGVCFMMASGIAVFLRVDRNDIVISTNSDDPEATSIGPYTVVRLHKQGATSSTSWAGSTQIQEATHIPGRLEIDGDAAGGYFYDDGENKDNALAYPTLYDWLKNAAESPVCKGRFVPINELTYRFDFVGTFGHASDGVTVADLAAGEKPKIEFIADVVTGATADVPGLGSGDAESIEFATGEGIANDEQPSVPQPLHNCPSVGEEEDARLYPWTIGIVSGATVGTGGYKVISPNVPPNLLVYLHQADMMDAPEPFRAHHYVGINQDGATGVQYDGVNALEASFPTPADGQWLAGQTAQPGILLHFWRPLRLLMLQMQRQACLPFCSVARYTRTFSLEKQAAYNVTIRGEKGLPLMIGQRATADWTDGNYILQAINGGAYLGDVPGRPILSHTTFDTVTGTASARMFAIPSS